MSAFIPAKAYRGITYCTGTLFCLLSSLFCLCPSLPLAWLKCRGRAGQVPFLQLHRPFPLFCDPLFLLMVNLPTFLYQRQYIKYVHIFSFTCDTETGDQELVLLTQLLLFSSEPGSVQTILNYKYSICIWPNHYILTRNRNTHRGVLQLGQRQDMLELINRKYSSIFETRTISH